MNILSWLSEYKDIIAAFAAIVSSTGVVITLMITLISNYIEKKYKEAQNVGVYINADHKSKFNELFPSMDEQLNSPTPDPLICLSNQNKLPMYEPIIYIKDKTGNINTINYFSVLIPTVSTIRLLDIIPLSKDDDYHGILASIEFTDSNGKRWIRDFNGKLTQINLNENH